MQHPLMRSRSKRVSPETYQVEIQISVISNNDVEILACIAISIGFR